MKASEENKLEKEKQLIINSVDRVQLEKIKSIIKNYSSICNNNTVYRKVEIKSGGSYGNEK